MSESVKPSDRYASGDYLASNPTWHVEDSDWKAGKITSMLLKNGLNFRSAVEVGCGAGRILSSLQRRFPGDIRWCGWEVSPQAYGIARMESNERLSFHLGDFLAAETERFDLLLLIDVVEHVENPHAFVRAFRDRAEWKLFHIPLDLSALGVLRSWPLLTAKRDVGHLSYYTKDLALALLRDNGYEILAVDYTSIQLDGVGVQVRQRGRSIRRWLHRWKPDLAVRLLGGWSLMVLAK